MENLKTKNIIKVCIAVFAIYLCIHYWPDASKLLGAIFSALIPIICGCILAYLLNIVMSFYEKHLFSASKKKTIKNGRRAICLVLSILSLLAIIGLVIGLIVPQLISCIKLLVKEVPVAINDILIHMEKKNIFSEELIEKISSMDIKSELQKHIGSIFSGLGNVLNVFANLVSSIVSGVTTTFLSFIFAIYILAGKERLGAQVHRLMKHYIKERYYKKIQYVLSVLNDCFHRYVVGQCTEAVILGLLCTIGMLILRLPYAPMIGAVIAFTALIPVVGAYVGGAVGAFLIFMESPIQALIFIIFLVVLQQIEGNLIYPRVVGSSIGLPGIWVLAAVTVGGSISGVFGMLIGVPLAATIYRLLKNDINKKVPEKNNFNNKKLKDKELSQKDLPEASPKG